MTKREIRILFSLNETKTVITSICGSVGSQWKEINSDGEKKIETPVIHSGITQTVQKSRIERNDRWVEKESSSCHHHKKFFRSQFYIKRKWGKEVERERESLLLAPLTQFCSVLHPIQQSMIIDSNFQIQKGTNQLTGANLIPVSSFSLDVCTWCLPSHVPESYDTPKPHFRRGTYSNRIGSKSSSLVLDHDKP